MYRVVGVRASALVVEQCKGIARQHGWQFSDLARTFICLGAMSTFLTLRREKQLDRLKSEAVLTQMQSSLGNALGKRGGRPYNAGGGTVTELITIRLPSLLVRMITSYAEARGDSRNASYSRFLRNGMIIYLTAEKAFMEALLAVRNRAKTLDESA